MATFAVSSRDCIDKTKERERERERRENKRDLDLPKATHSTPDPPQLRAAFAARFQ